MVLGRTRGLLPCHCDVGVGARAARRMMLRVANRLVSRTSSTFPPIMAWRCSGLTNIELIENMSRNGLINSARVKNVGKIYPTVDHPISISEPSLSP